MIMSRAAVNKKEKSTALIEAAKDGNMNAFKQIMKGSPDINFIDRDGWTALQAAACEGHKDIAQALIYAGANPNQQHKGGHAALHWAAEWGYVDLIHDLLAVDAKIDQKGQDGRTPLIGAVLMDQTVACEELIKAGADIHIKDDLHGWSALHGAARCDRVQMAEDLITAGADTNAVDNVGWTPLMIACDQGHTQVAMQLVGASNIDLDIKSNDGNTALHLVKTTDVTTMLIELGADLSVKNKDGNTPLHCAAREGYTEVVRAMLDNGADKHAKNSKGKTAGDVAILEKIQQLLGVHTYTGGANNNKKAQGHSPTPAGFTTMNQFEPILGITKVVNKAPIPHFNNTAYNGGNNNNNNNTNNFGSHSASNYGESPHTPITPHTPVAPAAPATTTAPAPRIAATVTPTATAGPSPTSAAAGTAASFAETKAPAAAKPAAAPAVVAAAVAKPAAAATPTAAPAAAPVAATKPAATTAAAVPVSTTKHSADSEIPKLMAQALQQGSKEWRRSKLSIVGEGRAGKTALTNNIIGRPFEETSSTVGINQLTCDVRQLKTTAGHDAEPRWGVCKKAERELETALAQMLAHSKNKAHNHNTATPSKKGDIVSYMRSVQDTKTKLEMQLEEGSSAQVAHSAASGGSSSPYKGGAAGFSSASTTATTATASAPMGGAYKPSGAASAASKASDSTHASTAVTTSATAASTAVRKVDTSGLDEELVMKALATMKDEESGMLISLFDFGGQSVFDVIHHLFLTRNGVYALVFNMDWLLYDGPEKDKALRCLRHWLSSIAIHTFDKTTKMTAPIAFVGTRLDTVSSPASHATISTVLYETFSDNVAWRSVLANENGQDRNGKAFQWFFPVDNKKGKDGPTMKNLMSVVHKAMESATYTHKEVPLTWFKVMDLMTDASKDCLSLSEVTTIAAKCSVLEAEVPYLLSFLHDMGHLMWIDEPNLRNVAVLDPISFLVTPATIIICKITPDKGDPTHHVLPSHRECERMHKREWTLLKQEGVLSSALLPILWKDYARHTNMLLLLMVKFGLLVPVRAGKSATTQYLVPTLLSFTPLTDIMVVNWTDTTYESCYFVFTLSEELELATTLTAQDLKSSGFLPGGMFERIIGKALSWSQDTKGAAFSLQNVLLYKDMAVLAFGGQRFRLVNCSDIHSVRVDIEGKNPIGIQQKLSDIIHKIMDECMKSLRCFPAVCYTSPGIETQLNYDPLKKDLLMSELLIPLQQLRNAGKGESMLAWRGGRTLMSVADIKSKYGNWLQVYDLRESYDVFISYRWGDYDSDFTEALFDMLTNFSVGTNKRAIEVFLDRKRLQDGRRFKSDLASALTNSLIAMPIVSVDSLKRMVAHSVDNVDNLLMEWIIILECIAAKKIMKVYPILFGNRVLDLHSASPRVLDFFTDHTKDSLPKIKPTATLAQCKELLVQYGVHPSAHFSTYTVSSIVNEMMQFLLCKASDYDGSTLVETVADKLLTILTDCGSEALNRVNNGTRKAAPTIVTSDSTPSVTPTITPVATSAAPGAWKPKARGGAAAGAAVVSVPTAGAFAAPTSALMSSTMPNVAMPTFGATFAAPTAGFVGAPTAASAHTASVRKLVDLSVSDVCALVEHVGMKKLAEIFKSKEVSGAMLSYCEEVTDLQTEEYGVSNAALARGLLKNIQEWVEHGVPAL